MMGYNKVLVTVLIEHLKILNKNLTNINYENIEKELTDQSKLGESVIGNVTKASCYIL